MEIYYSICY